MSTAPRSGESPARSSISRASRWASGTPRVWMPTSAISSSDGFASMISWAIRESVRDGGPGSLTIPLAPLFEEAVGIDADPAMVAEAVRDAPANARFVQVQAEELPADLGSFRVLTLAQSFHWMEQGSVARAVHSMLEPGG